jgi:hypothetical protein
MEHVMLRPHVFAYCTAVVTVTELIPAEVTAQPNKSAWDSKH